MKVCPHIYEYIATEKVPTDQWHYAERIYKEEVITYCPLCHKHIRLSKDEWQKYKDDRNKYSEFYKEEENRLLIKLNKDKKCTFTCENSLFNLPIIIDPCLSVPVENVESLEQFYKKSRTNVKTNI